jgi:2-isopropylmalate synthase
MTIYTFDSTLRDGTQGEAVSFSVEDKLLVTQKLDELGIDYIEGGWPGSNPKDAEFFRRARELKLQHTRLTAFGSTRLAKNPVHQDRNVFALAAAGTPVVSVFGKTWDLHVQSALGIPLEENLKLITETVGFLKDHGKEVIYDAEHFFDGYTANPKYALLTLEAAKRAGADVLCLCDTNGGTLTSRLAAVVAEVRRQFDGAIGIHTHNDSDVAVANALAAVEAGATLVQGCLNGYGERCGNANLASIIANLELKLGYSTIGREKLATLASACRFIAELANLALRRDQSFVGSSAFAHKGGVHVSAVLKNPVTYEHIAPEAVGNRRRVLVSELSGRANIAYLLKEHPTGGRLDDSAHRQLLERVKQLEYEGYDLEAADGTFDLVVRCALQPDVHFFDVESYQVTLGATGSDPLYNTAKIALRVGDEAHVATVSAGSPLEALQRCLQTCLAAPYPHFEQICMTDYKVRLLDAHQGRGAKVRVLIEWRDRHRRWSTAGVSSSVVEASWNALLDATRLQLMRLAEQDARVGATSKAVV